MLDAKPKVVILAGPNGAGKSTFSPFLIRDTLGIVDYVNADDIARGLCAFHPESVAISAGRFMLTHLRDLAKRRASFALETTLASKTFAPWIAELIATGYHFDLYFLALPSVDLTIERVALRVSKGGHAIPDDVARRRFVAGLKNFFDLYLPLTNRWMLFDNTERKSPRAVAQGQGTRVHRIHDPAFWELVNNVASS